MEFRILGAGSLLGLTLMVATLTNPCTATHKTGIFTNEPYPTPRYLQETCSRMFSEMTPAECGKECLIRPGRCRFVAYDRFLRWCNLCSDWGSDYPHAEDLGERRIAVSDISTWNKVMVGECADDPCPSPFTQSCQTVDGHVSCVDEIECGVPVVLPQAKPSRGPHRDVGVVIRYTCVAWHWNRGIHPYSQCLSNGTWSLVEDPCTCARSDSLDNMAIGKATSQSSTYHFAGDSGNAVDGITDQNYFSESCSCTQSTATDSWWMVDISTNHCVTKVVIYNRGDCCGSRLRDVNITVGLESEGEFQPCAFFVGPGLIGEVVDLYCDTPVFGRWVKLQVPPGFLTLCEVEVY